MNYEELCRSLTASGTHMTMGEGKEIGKVPLVTLASSSGNDSSNSLLVAYLNSQGIQWLRDFNGTVWFFYDSQWARAVSRYDSETSQFHYERCIFV